MKRFPLVRATDRPRAFRSAMGSAAKPFSSLAGPSISPSRFWNIRTQAEQTPPESGSRDSGEE
jgi:hypothetical protein